MIAFEDKLEIDGISPDQTFSFIYRSKDRWEHTVTGVKDLETGETETKIYMLTDTEAIATLARWISGNEGIAAEFKPITDLTYKGTPDYLRIVP